MANEKGLQIIQLKYEIFGKVQGVFFRKHTKKKADSLGIHGWVQNTTQKSVKGEIEGNARQIEMMKNWLEKEGSPKSRIDKAVFGNQQVLHSFTHSDFKITK